ncbi:tripartite tricarboxylate transporter TctB family protein [Xanthobacteraceae bacterium Astr-EGSB]|uniref:tripartite tricarboxylate transporter TctB family protein n=1 Tax=Astrobacterium formosum TaxID=3069710 RepID=UPI0027B20360|nr:tripartite tricarboxylate transporter TctB family protein [Xanthobacteraceae bacterium Astr-EGSB]
MSDGEPQAGQRLNYQDLLFGLFMLAVAFGMTVATWKLRIGTAANMGPGYMPRAIAVGIAGFGIYFVVKSLLSQFKAVEPPQPRAVFGIVASVAVFGVLAPTMGLFLATLATVVVAGFASRETRFVENLLFGGAMAIGTVLLFIKGLSLPVPAWPW